MAWAMRCTNASSVVTRAASAPKRESMTGFGVSLPLMRPEYGE
jgi:hypothetical protein